MSLKDLYPNVRPSLLLDFANTKRLDPRITFVRTTTAPYYDGKTTTRAEENLLLRSQDLNNAVWTTSAINVTVAQNATAPDGTTTAVTITDDATNGTHRILHVQSVTPIPGSVTFTLSVFLKKGTLNYAYIGFRDGGTNNRYIAAAFDLDLGTAGDTFNPGGGTLVGSSITNVGNGWYRCTVTGSLSGTTNSNSHVIIGMATAATGISLGGFLGQTYAGTGSTILAWGAQLEQRSSATAYTPTTTHPVINYVPTLLTASANVARFDHNPVTGESLGLLIEEGSTNLFRRSEDFANTVWSKTNGSVLANSAFAPDGTPTADSFIENTVDGQHIISQTTTLTANTTYAMSVYAKAAGRYLIRLGGAFVNNWNPTNPIGVFDLSNGTATAITSNTAAFIRSVGHGWYRCTFVATFGANTDGGGMNISLTDGFGTQGNNIYTGDNYRGVHLWGGQLEEKAYPTSYIPTTESTATRNADNANMTETNFSSWYNPGEGTLCCDVRTFEYPSSTWFPRLWSITDGTSLNRIFATLTNIPGSPDLYSYPTVYYNSVTQADLFAGSTSRRFGPNTLHKTAFGYKNDDIGYSANGASIVTDTDAGIPVAVNQMAIGYRIETNSGFLNGTIARIAYYPIKFTSSQLEALGT